MKKTLSDQEWTLMKVLWEKGPSFLSNIMDETKEVLGWTRNTYMSYLKEMTNAGYIGWETVRGSRLYHARRTREECARIEGQTLLARMERDTTSLFVMNMVRDADLSEEALDNLRRLIDSLEHEKGMDT